MESDGEIEIPVEQPRPEATEARSGFLPALVMALIAALAVVPFGIGMLGFLSAPPSGSDLPIADTDPRFASCTVSNDSVLAAFPMAHAWDFSAHFPYALYTPETQTDAPAFAVVFTGLYPGPLMPMLLTDRSPAARALGPNEHDLCVWIGDVGTGDRMIYGNVDTTDMTATVPPTDGPRLPVIRAVPEFDACGGGAARSVMTAFPMPRASEYRGHLPHLPATPELETDAPAFVVVFAAADGSDRHDVCVIIGERGAQQRHDYAGVDTTGLTL
jgi:hypothetical protein